MASNWLMDGLILLLAALPAAAALIVYLLDGNLGRRGVTRISLTCTGLAFITAVTLLSMSIGGDPVSQHGLVDDQGKGWGSLLFDPLSVLMSVVIAGISFIVHLYSVRYMAEEPGYARFFILLDIMTSALLVMVAAGDLITLLVAWHIIGVVLYFLLGQRKD